MAKLRKMLNNIELPCLQSQMRLIDTQSRLTISSWCINYAEEVFLPLWEEYFPENDSCRNAINATKEYNNNKIDLKEANRYIMECRKAAQTTTGHIAQGCARTIDGACCTIHNPASSLCLALYGAPTLGYKALGLDTPWEEIEVYAIKECAKIEEALRMVSIKDEPNPAKIKWNC